MNYTIKLYTTVNPELSKDTIVLPSEVYKPENGFRDKVGLYIWSCVLLYYIFDPFNAIYQRFHTIDHNRHVPQNPGRCA